MATMCAAPLKPGLKTLKYTGTLVPIKCKGCLFETTSILVLLRHLSVGETKCQELKCDECLHLCFSTKQSLQRHIRFQHSSLIALKCECCAYTAKSSSYLQRHMFNKHLSVEEKEHKWFKCGHCDYQTPRRGKIEEHESRKHSLSRDSKVTWLKCTSCWYKTKFKIDLRRHIESKHTETSKIKCEICNLMVAKSYLKRHIARIHEQVDGKHKCAFCQRSFKGKDSLETHIQTEHTTVPEEHWQRCKDCPFRTLYKHQLELHILGKHLPSKKGGREVKLWLHCMYCDAKFRQKFNLMSHILRDHKCDEDGELAKCSFCDYSHIHKSSVEVHIRRKHIIEEVTCEHCGKICRNGTSLQDHLRRTKHKIPPQRREMNDEQVA